MDLSENQSKRLDELLAELYKTGYLHEDFLEVFFNNDLKMASAYLEVLRKHQLLGEEIPYEESTIPHVVFAEDKVVPLFIENGGFHRLYKKTKQEQRIIDLEEENKSLEVWKNRSELYILAFSTGSAIVTWLILHFS
ncbi:hypothetical protein ACD591_21140 [Rufibacter glacialis]|uniref:Uncharacterized protein n=1 Tax=Rufibacter glacialis TaxID=1259555 RepID=A0A5M8QU90_9BACT|nr:hypothetical protein [Rufibacter glacialis]KAA6438033.1 hypothetical protein FOE74_00820 [Rufibacter glacialis]GGK89563.1 hypothetical protein GCM10011405_41590 [Rufibacter glacialis]